MGKKSNRKQGRPSGAAAARAVPGRGGLEPRGAMRWGILAAVVLVALAILYPGPMFQKQVFIGSDSVNADAFAAAGDRSLAEGDYPHWNPYLFGGMPTFGSMAYVKYLYPPSIVLNFLQQKLGFPPLTWLLAHLVLGGLGMAWLLSRWKLPTAAIALGVLVWLMAPKVAAWGAHGHGSKLGAAMYLPWIVGWALHILDGRGARAVGMTGLLLGLQLLRSHPQISYYTLLVVGWFVLAFLAWPWQEEARRLAARVRWLRAGQVAGAIVLGFAISALLLLPAQQYGRISIRGQDTAGGGGVGLEYATGWSLAPSEVPTLVFPAAAGFGKATYLGAMPFNDYPNYLGWLTLLLAALAWRRGSRRLLIWLLVMCGLVLLVAFGRHGPGLYELLYRWLPYFNKFRIPSMMLILVTFAAALLVARGGARLAGGADEDPVLRRWPWPFFVLGALCLLGGATGLARGPFESALGTMAHASGRELVPVLVDEAWGLHRASLIRIGLILLVAGAALLASLRGALLRGPGLVWVLAALVAVDLYSVDRLIIRPETGLMSIGRDVSGQARLMPAARLTGPWRPATDDAAAAAGRRVAEAVGHDRVFPLGAESAQNTWMAAGVRSLGGYHAAKLAAYEQIRKRIYSDQPAGRLVAWLSGAVISLDRPLGQDGLQFFAHYGFDVAAQPLGSGPPYLYRNAAALPRARLVSDWQPVSELPEKDSLEPFLDALAEGSLPFEGVVRLDATPDPAPQKTDQALPEPTFVRDGMDEVVVRTDAEVPALLLLADLFAPGWRVEVDGQEKPLLRADLVLRAVALPAGPHEVRFVYFDPAVRLGLAVTLAGGFIALVLICWPLLDRRRAGATIDDPTTEVQSDD